MLSCEQKYKHHQNEIKKKTYILMINKIFYNSDKSYLQNINTILIKITFSSNNPTYNNN